MASMARVLKPGGALILNVAALEHPERQPRGAVGGSAALHQAADAAGAVARRPGAERITYTNFSLFPLMLATRTWQRFRGAARPETLTVGDLGALAGRSTAR